MITPLFLELPSSTSYEQLQNNIQFSDDYIGASHWVMKIPRTIYSVDLRTKHLLAKGKVSLQKIVKPNLQEKWKYFVITKSDGRKYYCSSQLYYEKGPLKVCETSLFTTKKERYEDFYLPKCLVLISQLPYYKLHVNLLKIHKQLRKAEPIISYNIDENKYKTYLYLTERNKERDWEFLDVRNGNKKIDVASGVSFGYYVHLCNEHIRGEAVYIQKETNRQVLHLYKLHQNNIFEMCYIFHLPFSPKTLRLILSAILLEKQVIFSCSNLNLTCLIIETLMKMISPFKWPHMYVPNLPFDMIETAQQSFTPYIVGVHRKDLRSIDVKGRVVVEVEEDQVKLEGIEAMPLIEESYLEYLAYENNEGKDYVAWEKQIRVKALLMMSKLIQQLESLQQCRNIPFSTFTSAQLPFLLELMQSSMMYKNLHYAKPNPLNTLLTIPFHYRRDYLLSNFNLIQSQAKYPARYDNEKRWIRHYEFISRSRSKIRETRRSLNERQFWSRAKLEELGQERTVSTTQSYIFL